MTSKELTLTEGAMLTTIDDITSIAKAFVASGFFTDVKSISQGIVKVQAGKELGLPPVYAMQNINMIKGKLCTSANTMALLVKRSGRYNYRIIEHTDLVCKIAFKELEGAAWVDVGESKFTMEDAKRAKLVYPDSAWVKYPRAMLFSRAISQGARLYTPDAIGGVYTSEEIRAIDGTVADEPDAVPEPVTVTEETAEAKAARESEPQPTVEETAQAAAQPQEQPPAEADNSQAFTGDPPPATEPTPPTDDGKAPIVIGQHDPLPTGKPGLKVQIRETGMIMAWVQSSDTSGGWRNQGVKPLPEQPATVTDDAPPATEDVPQDIPSFFSWLQSKGKKFGPTWFYKTFGGYTAESMKDASTVAKAYAEVKAIQSW